MDAARNENGRADAGIRVVLQVGRVWPASSLPPDTIALDGAVAGPLLDPERRRFSFDHHQDCIRLITSATCQQVLDALLAGLDPSGMSVLLNDVDGDTVLAVWLLRRHERWRCPVRRARVHPLVFSVGSCDAHGPAFPAAWPELARNFHAEVMEPTRRARPVPGRDLEAMDTLEKCLDRLEAWWNGGLTAVADSPAPQCVVPRLVRYRDWVLAQSDSDSSRVATAGFRWIYRQGFDRAVLCTPAEGGRFRYTLGRRSELVDRFPLPEFFAALNEAERTARNAPLEDGDRWGGAPSIGGSPRNGGSVLPPDEVARVINRTLADALPDRASRHPRGIVADSSFHVCHTSGAGALPWMERFECGGEMTETGSQPTEPREA